MEEELKDLGMSSKEAELSLISMIKFGNPIYNIMFIDSLMFPRHARWSLLFLNIIIHWFLCALIYGNMNDPLAAPDLNRSATALVMSDLWIPSIVPFVSMALMYLFVSLFRITQQRFKYASDLQTLKDML